MHAQTPAALEPDTGHNPLALSPQQVQAANLLAAGSSIDDACHKLTLGRTTLYRWRQMPAFAAYLNQLTRQHADQALTQSTQLLASAMHLLQQKLADPQTPADLQIRIAFRILALYSRPSYLRFLHTLPDDPASVEEQQMREGLRTAGCPEDMQMDGSDVQLYRGYQYDLLQQAQAFDARYPITAPAAPAAPTPIPAPPRTKVEQNGTPDRCSNAVTQALAGVRQGIASVAAA